MDALHQPTSSTDDDDGKKLRRREQNRLSAQRSYHKKQERISTLRAQVSQLESTYERHVNSLPREPVVDASLSCPPTASSPACVSGTVDAKSHAVSPSSPPQKSSHMQQLLANRSELQHENDALRRRIEDHTKFQFRMQSLAVDDESSMDPTGGDTRSRTGEPRFQPRIQMKRPLSVDECYAIGSSSYQYIRNHRFPDKYMTSGSSLCGWRDRRVLENGLLKVELRKTFQGHDIDLVTRTSWAAVQDPHKMSALYSLNMNMQSEIVQRIDDNNTVMYQSYETPERDAAGNETGAFVVMHHVMLLTMFATDRGYVMIFCSLDPDRLDDSDHIVDLAEEEEAAARGVTKRRRKQWFKKFSWLTFQRNGRQTRDDAFELSYLFTVPPQHGAKHYWPLEIILLMMRFEMAAVGPVVLLPPSTSTNNLKDEDEADGMKQHATDKEENDDDDEDSGIVIIENTPVKIEPLAHSGTEDVGIADDDMSELFTELFP